MRLSAPISEQRARPRAARTPARGLILLYHRVIALDADPQLLAVSPRNFAEQLDVLRAVGVPTRTADLTRAAAARPDRPLVAVTFDDGYFDNLEFARPLLDRFDMPATVFVCRDADAPREEFWWDALEHCVLRAARLAETLELELCGERLAWRAAPGDADTPSPPTWNVRSAAAPTARQQLYLELARRLKPAPAAQRAHAIAELYRWSGVSSPARATHRRLGDAELRTLAADGLIEIGGHTATHASLAHQPLDEQRSEITRNKRALESVLGRGIDSFSYPFGTSADYSPQTAALAREAGFAVACANFPGAVHADADAWALPRVIVRDWDGATFARELAQAWRRHG